MSEPALDILLEWEVIDKQVKEGTSMMHVVMNLSGHIHVNL